MSRSGSCGSGRSGIGLQEQGGKALPLREPRNRVESLYSCIIGRCNRIRFVMDVIDNDADASTIGYAESRSASPRRTRGVHVRTPFPSSKFYDPLIPLPVYLHMRQLAYACIKILVCPWHHRGAGRGSNFALRFRFPSLRLAGEILGRLVQEEHAGEIHGH